MAISRGRAASPIRPGLICKHTLLGEVPLRSTGEYVTEAAIVQLFDAYKGELERVNAIRPKERRIHGMRYSSFYTMFRFARLLGLVEHVRDEPMEFPPPGAPLLRIEKIRGEAQVRISMRKVFKLTQVGSADEVCWADLTNAWKKGAICGQPLRVPAVAPPIRPKVVRRPILVEKPPGFTPYEWRETPSVARFKSLLDHLKVLQQLGLDAPGVRQEVYSLSLHMGDWIIDTEDRLDDARAINNTKAINMYGIRLKLLTQADEALGDENIDGAVAAMEKLLGE